MFTNFKKNDSRFVAVHIFSYRNWRTPIPSRVFCILLSKTQVFLAKYIYLYDSFLTFPYIKKKNTIKTDNYLIRCRMWLFKCSAVLLEVEFLGHTEISGACILNIVSLIHRPLLAISLQRTGTRMEWIRTL